MVIYGWLKVDFGIFCLGKTCGGISIFCLAACFDFYNIKHTNCHSFAFTLPPGEGSWTPLCLVCVKNGGQPHTANCIGTMVLWGISGMPQRQLLGNQGNTMSIYAFALIRTPRGESVTMLTLWWVDMQSQDQGWTQPFYTKF